MSGAGPWAATMNVTVAVPVPAVLVAEIVAGKVPACVGVPLM